MQKIIIGIVTILIGLYFAHNADISLQDPQNIVTTDFELAIDSHTAAEDAKLRMLKAIVVRCRALPTDGLMESDAMKSAINILSSMENSSAARHQYAKDIAASITCRH